MRAAPPTAQARSFLKLLAVNVQLFVSDLDGSGWRHGIDEFTQHARNLARIDFVIGTGGNGRAKTNEFSNEFEDVRESN